MKVDAHSTYPRDYITACVRHLFGLWCRHDRRDLFHYAERYDAHGSVDRRSPGPLVCIWEMPTSRSDRVNPAGPMQSPRLLEKRVTRRKLGPFE